MFTRLLRRRLFYLPRNSRSSCVYPVALLPGVVLHHNVITSTREWISLNCLSLLIIGIFHGLFYGKEFCSRCISSSSSNLFFGIVHLLYFSYSYFYLLQRLPSTGISYDQHSSYYFYSRSCRLISSS